MILAMHRLRKDEEGQTLVLAAIFGLILCLCVLGTVNIGRAVYDKMQLQTAADSAAYSQAAVAARVMNFTAYTNRAMVVHYASIMAMSAYLTYFHFLWGMAQPAVKYLQWVPYLGQVMQAIDQIVSTLIKVLDVVVAVVTPIIAAANVILYAFQEGAWWSFTSRIAGMAPEAHSGDTNTRPYQTLGALWDTLFLAANQASWAQVRGSTLMPTNSVNSLKIIYNASDDNTQLARMHMVEIANSARQPWVAYGDKATALSIVPGPRHWWWGPSWGGFGSVARTELGSFTPTGNFIGDIAKGSGQVWSSNRLLAAIKKFFGVGPIGCNFDIRVRLFTVTTMDRFFPWPAPNDNSYATGFDVDSAGGICNKILGALLKFILGSTIGAFSAQAQSLATQQFKQTTQTRIFWVSPYVAFSPVANAKPQNGITGAPGNFNQPDFIVGLNKPAADYNAAAGASKIFGHKFVSRLGGARGTGSTDFAMTTNKTVPTLPDGINAVSTAQVYYHRPGDWKEMPNLFNPLWGARLLPVRESNAWAKLPVLANNPIFNTYLNH